MREIFVRLLKSLWVFNILCIVGVLSFFIFFVVIDLSSGVSLIELIKFYIKEVAPFVGIFILTTSILMFLQYVLLGNSNPKILFKRLSH